MSLCCDESRKKGYEMTTATSYRYITRTDGIRSGHAIIEGTRIGVHDIVGMVLNGSSVDDVVRSLPPVTRAQVYEALAYYEDNKEEVDVLVARQMAAAEA